MSGIFLLATYTDPNADIETALRTDQGGLDTAFVVLLGLVGSALIVATVVWAIRRGRNPL
jgi:hypothetical protein